MDGIISYALSKKYTQESLLGGGAIVGKNVTISSITPIDGGNRVTFSYTLDDGTVKTSAMDVMDGIDGVAGKDGLNGKDGDDGISISKVEKINTVDLVDTYRITFSNNTFFDYSVTNGIQGVQGIKGEKGDQGEQGVQGVQGIKGDKGDDGYPFLIYKEYSDISEFNKNDFPEIGLMFMVKSDSTSSYPVYRYTGDTTTPYSHVTNLEAGQGIKGDKGDKGDTGEQGVAGENGKDGITYTPVIGTVVSGTTASASVTINDDTYTAAFDFVIPKGDKGDAGECIVDDALSDTSENPVQNKVIKAAIDEKADTTVATTTADGLMSAEDKVKLDAFEITTTGGKLHDNDIATTNNISNPNLLTNPDFSINQRGISGAFSDTGKYFVDRWRLVSGTVTVNSDGTLTLDGSICQPLENAAGANVTASVSAGTAVYDDTTKTFTITGNGDVISWAKLEIGCAATAFIPPDPATEMMKCMYYYEKIVCSNDMYNVASQYFNNLSDASFTIPMSLKRIASPTSAVDCSGMTYVNSESLVGVSGAYAVSYTTNSVSIVANLLSPTTVCTHGWMVDFTIEIDAEIY